MTHSGGADRGVAQEDNKVVKQWASRRSSTSSRRITSRSREALVSADFEAGAAVAGQKFYFLKNERCSLEIALIHYAFDTLLKAWLHADHHARFGPCRRARRHRLYAARRRDADLLDRNSDLCLIATAEITLGGMPSRQDHGRGQAAAK